MVDCYLCGRNVEEALTVRVDFGVFVTEVCHECAEQGDEAGQEEADAA